MLHDLTGKSDERLVAHITKQIAVTIEGASLALDILRAQIDPAKGRRLISDIEHRGDQHRAALVQQLSKTISTPVDREDLFRLSRSVDDVLDNLRDFIRELHLFGAPSRSCYRNAVEAVIEGLTGLQRAVDQLCNNTASVMTDSLAAKKAGNTIRRTYQVALSELFAEELSVDLLKDRELLRRLDIVGLRLGEAVDALADGSMKRSH